MPETPKPLPDSPATRTLTPIQNVICGFLGVVVPRTVFAPLDTIKLMAANHRGPLLPEIARRLTSEGTISMWNGALLDWVRFPPQFLLRFFVSRQLRDSTFFKDRSVICDNLAAVLSISAIHPIEVVHSLMQGNPIKFPTIATTVSWVLKTNGYAGFYRGLLPTVLGYIPYRAVQYGSVPLVEHLMRRQLKSSGHPLVNEIVASTAITAFAQFASFPFEVIRKRMMSDPSIRHKSFTEVCVETYKERGVRGFYDSFGFAMIRLVPILWTQQIATRELRKFLQRFNYITQKHQL
jgi:solute carrier family 25 phosphate transporter 23/24/25/41